MHALTILPWVRAAPLKRSPSGVLHMFNIPPSIEPLFRRAGWQSPVQPEIASPVASVDDMLQVIDEFREDYPFPI